MNTVPNVKSWSKSDNGKKPWFCRFYQNGTCQHTKDNEVAGKMHRHICAYCLQQGCMLNHSEEDCGLVKSKSG